MKNGVGSGSISQRYGSRDPDLHQNVTDPQHCWQGGSQAPEAKVRLSGDRLGTSRTLAGASQAPETKVRLSGDRERNITYLGRGITGPGDKGPVVRGQEKGHDVLWAESVGDPEPDPHVFGPPGYGSINQKYESGSGSGSFPFVIMC
jgi:hypothetical protein